MIEYPHSQEVEIPAKPAINVMLDLETLGTKPGCVILSIAAVTFAVDDAIPTYVFSNLVERGSCVSVGLHIEPKNLEWWMQQPEELRVKNFSGSIPLCEALDSFTKWYSGLSQHYEVTLWCKGADFDHPILREAYEKCCMPYPVHYREVRCFRTLEALFGWIIEDQSKLAHGTKHDALDDAKYQASIAKEILTALVTGDLL